MITVERLTHWLLGCGRVCVRVGVNASAVLYIMNYVSYISRKRYVHRVKLLIIIFNWTCNCCALFTLYDWNVTKTNSIADLECHWRINIPISLYRTIHSTIISLVYQVVNNTIRFVRCWDFPFRAEVRRADSHLCSCMIFVSTMYPHGRVLRTQKLTPLCWRPTAIIISLLSPELARIQLFMELLILPGNGVFERIYGMKYSWKGHKDRKRHKHRIKRSGQARLVYVININRNIPTTWRKARGDYQGWELYEGETQSIVSKVSLTLTFR